MNTRRACILAALVIGAFALAGCATFPFLRIAVPQGPGQRESPALRNGQIVEVTGLVAVDRGRILVQDTSSPAVFTLVGLQPQAQRDLAGLEGRIVKLRLRVVSSQGTRAYNAQYVGLLTR